MYEGKGFMPTLPLFISEMDHVLNYIQEWEGSYA